MNSGSPSLRQDAGHAKPGLAFCQGVQTGYLHITYHVTGHSLFEEGWPHQFNPKGPNLLLTEIGERVLLRALH